ncbi:hypothetical protein B005_3728 [Nocardiopsis alba ATCC BAA-2165]|uniref:Uncharacterized protein n=1 Tax=Nocardiopsis alba (strain ATCC BAA-2165 / BE74) TaxID=1205910 RepID=J7L9D9_NOCAA|nr:hypothetical protein B005_3728 [Nocardiopsis alba ATCC BAA-2165]
MSPPRTAVEPRGWTAPDRKIGRDHVVHRKTGSGGNVGRCEDCPPDSPGRRGAAHRLL